MATKRVGINEVDGMPELIRNFGGLHKMTDDTSIKMAFIDVGKEMRTHMQSRIRSGKSGPHIIRKGQKHVIRPGDLKRGIAVKPFSKTGESFAFVAIERKIAPHANWVERGHGGKRPAPAHPFFRPVVDEYATNGRLARVVGDAIRKKVESK